MDESIIHDYQQQLNYLDTYCKEVRPPLIDLKPVEIEPESDEPFAEKFDRYDSNPETLSEFIHFSKYGYFLRLKDGTTINQD